MKQTIITLLAVLSFAIAGNAQIKHWEHNFYLGAGGTNSSEYGEAPYAFHIGYGLNYYLSSQWSIMPGVRYRSKFEIRRAGDGVGSYDCSYIDVPLLAQYHLSSQDISGLLVECGPVLSFIESNSKFYIDADPQDDLNGKDIYKSIDFGIQPGIYYQIGKHWRIGVQSYIGLSNIMKEYPKVSSYHLRDLVCTVNLHF